MLNIFYHNNLKNKKRKRNFLTEALSEKVQELNTQQDLDTRGAQGICVRCTGQWGQNMSLLICTSKE